MQGFNILVMSLREPSVCLITPRPGQFKASQKAVGSTAQRTDIEEDCAVEPLVDNVAREHLVVKGLRRCY